MRGEEIYNKITERGMKAGFNTQIREYGQVLLTALFTVGPEELFKALEEAQRTRQKVELLSPFYDDPSVRVCCEPYGIRLVKKQKKTRMQKGQV